MTTSMGGTGITFKKISNLSNKAYYFLKKLQVIIFFFFFFYFGNSQTHWPKSLLFKNMFDILNVSM